MGKDKVKKKNRINGSQDRMEGNIVSLTQHDYYGSLLHNDTHIACIELLAFSVGIDGEGRRERSWNSEFHKQMLRIVFAYD